MTSPDGNVQIRSILERRIVLARNQGSLVVATVSQEELHLPFEEETFALSLLLSVPESELVTDGDVRRAVTLLNETSILNDVFRSPGWELPGPYAAILRRLPIGLPRPTETSQLIDQVVRYSLAATTNAPLHPFLRGAIDFVVEESDDVRALLTDYQVSRQAFTTTLSLFTGAQPLRLQPDLLAQLYAVEIPFARSPKMGSETLAAVVREAKQFVVAPIYMGGLVSAGALMQGQYVTAILSSGAGVGSTLILVAGVSLADRLATFLES